MVLSLSRERHKFIGLSDLSDVHIQPVSNRIQSRIEFFFFSVCCSTSLSFSSWSSSFWQNVFLIAVVPRDVNRCKRKKYVCVGGGGLHGQLK